MKNWINKNYKFIIDNIDVSSEMKRFGSFLGDDGMDFLLDMNRSHN